MQISWFKLVLILRIWACLLFSFKPNHYYQNSVFMSVINSTKYHKNFIQFSLILFLSHSITLTRSTSHFKGTLHTQPDVMEFICIEFHTGTSTWTTIPHYKIYTWIWSSISIFIKQCSNSEDNLHRIWSIHTIIH